jgi:hypothetical protein
MTKFLFADVMKSACRHCATIGRAKLKELFDRGLVPKASDPTATVSFVRFEDRTYAVTAAHVKATFAGQAEAEGTKFEPYFLPAGRGLLLNLPLIIPPPVIPARQPDICLRRVDNDFPSRIGKEAFFLHPEVRPAFPVEYAGAVGFPTAGKSIRSVPDGTRLEMRCVHAIAEGRSGPADADQIQFFSEIDQPVDATSLSGMSGGPVFWSDGTVLGLLGFVKEALDAETPKGESSIYSGPRVSFICERASYETFRQWAEFSDAEFIRKREAMSEWALAQAKHGSKKI